MGKRYKQYSNEFKEQIINDILQGYKSQAQICREYGLSSSTLWEWQKKYEKGILYKDSGPRPEEEALYKRIADLERKVGQQALEIDLLRQAKKLSEQLRRERSSRKPITGISAGGAR